MEEVEEVEEGRRQGVDLNQHGDEPEEELHAAGLTWDTVARRAQDRGN